MSNSQQKGQTSEQITCHICEMNYNLKQHIPYILCKNQHTISGQCRKQILNKETCPYCREPLSKGKRVNKTILSAVLEKNGEKRQIPVSKKSNSSNEKSEPNPESVQNLAEIIELNQNIKTQPTNREQQAAPHPNRSNNCQPNCYHFLLFVFIALDLAFSTEMIIMGIFEFDYSPQVGTTILEIEQQPLQTKILAWSVLIIGILESVMLVATGVAMIYYFRNWIGREAYELRIKIWMIVLLGFNITEYFDLVLFKVQNEAISDRFSIFVFSFWFAFPLLKLFKLIVVGLSPKELQ